MKILVYVVTPDKGHNPCVEKNIEGVFEWIRMAWAGDTITIEPKKMEESEYAALPEYLGP